MSVLHPMLLWATGALAMVVTGLHFLMTRQPRPMVFPTARFVPRARVRATALEIQFSDRLLLLLRVLAVGLIGLALSQPRITLNKQSVAHIVAVDGSPTAARTASWRETVKRTTKDAAAVIVFDRTAREVKPSEVDDLILQASRKDAPGRLSVALIAALRTATHLRDTADTLHFTIVSPFLADSFDAATPAIRALWPGHIDLLRTEVAPLTKPTARIQVQWMNDTPSSVWVRRREVDQAFGVYSQAATIIAPFKREWRLAAPVDAHTAVIARWLDGEPAAVEQEINGVTLRSVGFKLPTEGDISLRPEFNRFAEWLIGSRNSADEQELMGAAALKLLAGDGEASKSAAHVRSMQPTALTAWLLGIGVALLLHELFVRSRRRADETVVEESRLRVR